MQDLCLIIPCYNEERRLHVDEVAAFLQRRPHSAVCLVDDGSRDGTLTILERLREGFPGRVDIVALGRNGGKAEAVRRGVQHAARLARFSFIGYWDADLSTPLEEVDHLLAAFAEYPGCLVVMGSRVRRLGSAIDRRPLRHYLGRIFSTAASLALAMPVYDSQCGAKIVRSEVAGVLFDKPFMTRWLFDVEMLARLRNHLGPAVLGAVVEVPLHVWYAVSGSKLRLSDCVGVPIALCRIWWKYR
jgi:glycosyltransferase involved in cell wall biosynthesis